MPEGTIYIDTTGRISGTIKKDDGTALAGTSITALTITIRNRDSAKTIVNGKNETALTPATSVDANGVIGIDLVPADNVLIDSSKAEETHRVILKFTYNAGVDKGLVYADYKVQNPAVV